MTNFEWYKDELLASLLIGKEVIIEGESITITREWLCAKAKTPTASEIFSMMFPSVNPPSES